MVKPGQADRWVCSECSNSFHRELVDPPARPELPCHHAQAPDIMLCKLSHDPDIRQKERVSGRNTLRIFDGVPTDDDCAPALIDPSSVRVLDTTAHANGHWEHIVCG